MSLFLFLFLLDSLVVFLLEGLLSSIFVFNVLGFIGLSLFSLEYLSQKGTKWIYVAAILCLIANPLFESLRELLTIEKGGAWLNVKDNIYFKLRISLFLVLTISTVAIHKLFEINNKLKFIILCLNTLLLLTLYNSYLYNTHYLMSFLNLPIGLLIGTKNSMHNWPFLVWFPVTSAGYLIFNRVNTRKNSNWQDFSFFVLCLLYFLSYTFIRLDTVYLSNMSKMSLISKKIFQADSLNVMVVIAFFTINLKIVETFIDKIKFLSSLSVRQLSRWILPIYIFHIVYLYHMTRALKTVIGPGWSILILSLSAILFSIILAKVLDYYFHNKKIELTFTKVK